MSVAFTRQLGSQPGVQLNPIRDDSEGFAPDNSDQSFGIAMRALRGRIDKPFKVNRSNVLQRLGAGEPLRVSALNEAHIHVGEALQKGAYEAVIYRLHSAAAKLSYIVVKSDAAGTVSFSVEPKVPTEPYLFAIRHLECHNDGLVIRFHAEGVTDEAGVATDASLLSLQLVDADGSVLYEFVGSLDRAAQDDYGQSAFLEDVVSTRTDAVEISVGPKATVVPDSDAYGTNADGFEKWAVSSTQMYFVEGGTAYTTLDYMAARRALASTEYDYGYIASGGSQSPALIAQLVQLGYDTNRQPRIDVPGTLTPAEAIAFVNQLNVDTHYAAFFWAPLKCDDPIGINGKSVIGTSALNIAFACARNAQTDANGFSPKNYPIAGNIFPVDRTGIIQIYSPEPPELSNLAKAKINPVIYKRYNGGGKYVFSDSLTAAKTDASLRKLVSVADRSSTIDEWVTRFGEETVQLPMEIAVKKMSDFMQRLFEGAQTAKWITPSKTMNGAAFQFSVTPNNLHPEDRMDVKHGLHYDGTNRQIFVTQTLVR